MIQSQSHKIQITEAIGRPKRRVHISTLSLIAANNTAAPKILPFHLRAIFDSGEKQRRLRFHSSPSPSMASAVHTGITPQTLAPASKSIIKPFKNQLLSSKFPPLQQLSLTAVSSTPKRCLAVRLVTKELDVLPLQIGDSIDQQVGTMAMVIDREGDGGDLMGQVVGGFGGGGGGGEKEGEEDIEKLIDRAINASIVLAAGSFAVTKLLTIDHDYWHGWTLFEILRYAPLHSWTAYEEALKTNPVLAKMMISGVVYSVGDWIAQCFEGKPLFEFDRARMFRSGLVGFTLHGSLSHYYYEFCEALFPFKDWWVVPAKVAFDQTAWSAVWNSIYYTVVGILRRDSPVTIFNELRATFWPMLTAGWKLWPFAHLITYGVIPVEQRLLWVDSIELIWVTILSTYSNEKSEARIADASTETNSTSSTDLPEV